MANGSIVSGGTVELYFTGLLHEIGLIDITIFLLQDRGSSIPQGDQEKCNYSRTTQQDSFCTPGLKDFQPFDRESAVKSLRKTTFQLGDRRIPEYLGTTAGDSYPSRLMTGSAQCSDY